MGRWAVVPLIVGMWLPAVVWACDQGDARARWYQAQSAGEIRGVAMVQRVPTVYVDGAVWRQIDIDARRSVALTLECIVAGPGNVLREISIRDAGGLPLARWDGIRRNLEVLR